MQEKQREFIPIYAMGEPVIISAKDTDAQGIDKPIINMRNYEEWLNHNDLYQVSSQPTIKREPVYVLGHADPMCYARLKEKKMTEYNPAHNTSISGAELVVYIGTDKLGFQVVASVESAMWDQKDLHLSQVLFGNSVDIRDLVKNRPDIILLGANEYGGAIFKRFKKVKVVRDSGDASIDSIKLTQSVSLKAKSIDPWRDPNAYPNLMLS